MTGLTPAHDAELAKPKAVQFGAVQIDLPSYTLRLLDGAGQTDFNGGTFLGRDPTFGVLAAIDSIDDGMGDEAPAISITLHPPSDAAAADLSSPAMQGSRVRVWLGALTRSTGAVIADPYLLFDGELDQPILTVSKNQRVLEYECVSSFERHFDNDEGFRLSDANHQRVWPGEQGLEHMTGLVKKIYWGLPTPGASGGVRGGGGSRGFVDGIGKVVHK